MTGYHLALLLFVILSAARDVFAGTLLRPGDLDPVFMTWVFCLVTGILFWALTSVRLRSLYAFSEFIELPRKHRTRLILLNVSTMLAYVTTFVAISRIDPYSNSLIDYGATPIVSAILAAIVRQERIGSLGKLGMGIAALGIVILTRAISGTTSAQHLGVGIACALLSCGFASWNNVLNKDLVTVVKPRERLVALRLMLAIVVLGAYVVGRGVPAGAPWAMLCLVGLLGIAVPLYLVVYAFEQLEVRHLAMAFFLIPVAVFAFSVLAGLLHFSWASLAAGCIVVAGVFVAEKGEHSKAPEQLPSPQSG
jgi:drug/metabolite transporter (DMT)-like permease